MMHRFFLAVLLMPTLLLSDINPPRVNGDVNSKRGTTVTVIVHVTFVESPISGEMTPEEIEATTEGRCSVNPEDPTEILCQ